MDSGEFVGYDREDSERADEPANVLVLGGAMGNESRRAYFETFAPADPGTSRVIAVNYTQSPDDWLSDWRRFVGTDPAECVIVSVGETVRSTATGPEATENSISSGSADGVGRVVRSVETPDDLTGLGIAISEHLSEWAPADTGAGTGEIVLSFDSLTIPLQYVDLQRVFRFLHVMTNRARTSRASSFFHVDPDAHDEQTVTTLASLFDTVIEYEGDGEWSTGPR